MSADDDVVQEVRKSATRMEPGGVASKARLEKEEADARELDWSHEGNYVRPH